MSITKTNKIYNNTSVKSHKPNVVFQQKLFKKYVDSKALNNF